MDNKVNDLFSFYLTEDDANSVFRDRKFPEGDGGEFESSLDRDTDGSDFETDGLGFDATETQLDNFAEVYGKVTMLDNTINDLVDPENESNLTRLLAVYDRPDSVGNGLSDKLTKPISNAAKALSEVKITLNQIASAEPALKRKIAALKSR